MTEKRLAASATVPDFSPGHPPALSVNQGESFWVQTRDRFVDAARGEPLSRESVTAMVGPVHVEDVVPGDVLAVEVLAITSRTGRAYLLASPGYGVLGERISPRVRDVAVTSEQVHLDEGTSIPLRPMIGKIGVATVHGPVEGTACGAHGGAVSNTLLGPGATLLVEPECAGGGLRLEDVHAHMGDGEATASAVEMAADVRLRCSVYAGGPLQGPMILTGTEAVTLGYADTLDAAAHMATERMLSLVMQRRGVDLTDAALLVGAAVDVRIAFFGARPCKAYAVIERALVGL